MWETTGVRVMSIAWLNGIRGNGRKPTRTTRREREAIVMELRELDKELNIPETAKERQQRQNYVRGYD